MGGNRTRGAHDPPRRLGAFGRVSGWSSGRGGALAGSGASRRVPHLPDENRGAISLAPRGPRAPDGGRATTGVEQASHCGADRRGGGADPWGPDKVVSASRRGGGIRWTGTGRALAHNR